MSRQVPQIAVDFIKREEDFVPFAYDDAEYPPKLVASGQQIRGTLTGGYGHTGSDVTAGMTVSQDQADAWLRNDLDVAAQTLSDRIGSVVDDLTENQYAAMLSFTFNTAARPSYSIWKVLRAKQYDQVPAQLMLYVMGTKDGSLVKMNGLVQRRADEVVLWSTAEPGSVPDKPPSSVTRTIPTPPVPMDPDPAHKSKTLIASAATAVASAPVAIKQVSDAMAPYAGHSDTVAHVVAGLALVAAICAGATVAFYAWHKHVARN